MTTLFFLIPLIAKANSSNWSMVERNLNRVVASMVNQTDTRWEAIIIHQGAPQISIQDPRIRLIESKLPVNDDFMRGARDKYQKRKLAASILKQEGRSGYFFGLDADDLVHKDLVKHILDSENQADAFVIMSGIKADVANRRYQFVPEAFYRRCGSCFVLGLENHELPDDYKDKSSLYSKCIKGKHAVHHENALALGKKVTWIDFPAVVYVVNHQVSLWSIKRQGKSQDINVRPADSKKCEAFYRTFFGQATECDDAKKSFLLSLLRKVFNTLSKVAARQ